MSDLPEKAIGLQLYKIVGDRLIACEEVYFVGGRPAVDTVLRRAAVSGRMEIGGNIENHFADVLVDRDGSWEETVALDAKSYRALKTRWMRCKVELSDAR